MLHHCHGLRQEVLLLKLQRVSSWVVRPMSTNKVMIHTLCNAQHGVPIFYNGPAPSLLNTARSHGGTKE